MSYVRPDEQARISYDMIKSGQFEKALQSAAVAGGPDLSKLGQAHRQGQAARLLGLRQVPLAGGRLQRVRGRWPVHHRVHAPEGEALTRVSAAPELTPVRRAGLHRLAAVSFESWKRIHRGGCGGRRERQERQARKEREQKIENPIIQKCV